MKVRIAKGFTSVLSAVGALFLSSVGNAGDWGITLE